MDAIQPFQNTSVVNPPVIEQKFCPVKKIALDALKVLGLVLMAAGVGCFIAGLQAPAIALLVTGVASLVLGFLLPKSDEKGSAATGPESPPQPLPKENVGLPVVEKKETVLPVLRQTLRTKIESIPALEALAEGRVVDKLSAATRGQAAGDALGVATNCLLKEQVMLGHRRGTGALNVDHPAFHPDLKEREPILYQKLSKFPENSFTDVTEQATLIIRAINQHETHPEKPLEIHFAEQLHHWLHHGLDDFKGAYTSNEAQPLNRCRHITIATKNLLEHKDFLQNPVKVALEAWGDNEAYRPRDCFQPVMRASVLGTIYYRDLTAVVEKTILFASVTDADPSSISSAVALSVAIALLLRGHDSIEEITSHSLDIAKIVLRDQMEQKAPYYEGRWETLEELNDQYAKELEAHIRGSWETLQLDDRENTFKGYAYKCVGAAFCALRRAEECNRQNDPEPFRTVIQEVIIEGGYASANAAAAGALIGTYLGLDSIPNSWLNFNDNSLLVVKQNEDLVQRLSEVVLKTTSESVN